MDFRITKTILLHALGSLYEIGTGQSFVQRVLRAKLKGTKRYPTAAEAARLNSQALRSI